jgi:endonuclease/exonuclease/phosphatase family metal-dependent hydrolase
MRRLVAGMVLLINSIISYSNTSDSLLVAFWNLENFFDWTDESAKERWTKTRFYTKCDAVAKTIFWMSDRYGKMPDVVGFAEIGDRRVLDKLLRSTLLRKYDYQIVHYDSADRRGIDVALIYRRSSFKYVGSRTFTPSADGKPLRTRDILLVSLEESTGRRLEFLVNHHPSKYGGEKASERRREVVMDKLVFLCDSLQNNDVSDAVIAMGDFNDTPDSDNFSILDSIMFNHGDKLYCKREGTIRYEGRWELIDMFVTSHELNCTMYICKPDHLMTWDNVHAGYKPFRTYSGPRYVGGVSDHLPIVLMVD